MPSDGHILRPFCCKVSYPRNRRRWLASPLPVTHPASWASPPIFGPIGLASLLYGIMNDLKNIAPRLIIAHAVLGNVVHLDQGVVEQIWNDQPSVILSLPEGKGPPGTKRGGLLLLLMSSNYYANRCAKLNCPEHGTRMPGPPTRGVDVTLSCGRYRPPLSRVFILRTVNQR